MRSLDLARESPRRRSTCWWSSRSGRHARQREVIRLSRHGDILERRYCCPRQHGGRGGRPNITSVYAKRGTDLHEVAAACLRENLSPFDVIPEDPEGAELVMAYLIEVQSAHDRLGGTLHVEQAFELSALSDLYWGTADAVILSPPTLYVADLKTGRGHAVPVRRPDGRVNLQLGGYGLGALHGLPAGLAPRDPHRSSLCVDQPALGAAPRGPS